MPAIARSPSIASDDPITEDAQVSDRRSRFVHAVTTALVLVLGVPCVLRAQYMPLERDERLQIPRVQPPATFELGAATGYNGWFTSDDDDSEAGVGHAVDYHLAGIPFWEVRATASAAGASIVGASVRGAIRGSWGALPITASNADAEKTIAGVDAFVDLLFLGETRQGLAYGVLSGLRLDFRRIDYHGPATTVERTAFLDSGGLILFLYTFHN